MKKKSLQDARVIEIAKLQYDTYSTKNYWLLRDGDIICIHKQKSGEESIQDINIHKKDFDRLIKAYQKPQKMWKGKKKIKPAFSIGWFKGNPPKFGVTIETIEDYPIGTYSVYFGIYFWKFELTIGIVRE